MSVLDEHLKKHRRRLIDREEAAVRELLASYESVKRELRRQVLVLQDKIKKAQAAGEVISEAWFLKERRLQTLIDQVKKEIDDFGRTAAAVTTREQAAAMTIAVDQAKETIELITDNGERIGSLINPSAIQNAVGMMGDGSPLLDYYSRKLAPEVAAAIRREVVEAAAMGTPFNVIARRLEKAGDITRQRALMVARTEVNRVRRETTRQFFEDNADVITGWEWVASKSARTCAACLALDGRIFEVKEVFPQHVNCRCTMIAVIDGVTRPKRVIGSEWFDEQPDDVKEEILGRDAFAALQRGEVELKDFVGGANSKEFGRSVYTRPISAILMNKK